ncbi:uncharacterized protein BT62DRAFT_926638 [Guyanagaster necrorhizus]|uniref:Uncharacterized protein n=1 Tax=Guyanagaster necrorhizus TaxID=856835 RepID=A0A9P7W0D6_9AGAR|nr:uncharacterized protein BT62DRAFT_926638 [Guyanagaster necrorhizus MCA 3950]KAG7450976.1 hypothetical protein BT62DRAFT_926638 [Guyanagaster necrorhizus MCA 3950]
MRFFFLAVTALFVAIAEAQLTETIVDANAESVVIVVSTNTLLGVVTTQTLETLTGTSRTTATTALTTATTTALTTAATATTATTNTDTTTTVAQVVGAPASTSGTPHGPTPYTYTTTIDGITTLIVDTFTPTFPATTPTTAPATGSIMAFSEYESIYGTPSAASSKASPVVLVSQKALMGMVVTTVVCLLGGVWTILA